MHRKNYNIAREVFEYERLRKENNANLFYTRSAKVDRIICQEERHV